MTTIPTPTSLADAITQMRTYQLQVFGTAMNNAVNNRRKQPDGAAQPAAARRPRPPQGAGGPRDRAGADAVLARAARAPRDDGERSPRTRRLQRAHRSDEADAGRGEGRLRQAQA